MREALVSDTSYTSDTFFRKSHGKYSLGKVLEVVSDVSNVSGNAHDLERLSDILPRAMAALVRGWKGTS